MPYDHKQVSVRYTAPMLKGRMVKVDEGLAELLQAIWSHGIDTVLSCQENQPGIAWIMFPAPVEARHFLNRVAQYPEKAKQPWRTLYGRLANYSNDKSWEYSLIPVNRGVTEIIDDEADEINEFYEGYNDFDFEVSIRFPVADIPRIIKQLRKPPKKRKTPA